MLCVNLCFILIFSIHSLAEAQHIPLNQHPLLNVKNEVPINSNYQETLADCPKKYYRYGGHTLTSSLSVEANQHHSLSHFAVLGNEVDAKCLGIIISKTWILAEAECVQKNEKSLKFAKIGVGRNGQWKDVDVKFVKIKHTVRGESKLALLETEEMNFEKNVISACFLLSSDSNYLEAVQKIVYESGSLQIMADDSKINSSLILTQKQLILGVKSIPFIIKFSKITSKTFVLNKDWIESTTNLSFTEKACAQRYLDDRLLEPYVSKLTPESTKQSGEYYFVYKDALLQHSRRFFRATIEWDNEGHVCGGSLITEKHIVTSAKCLQQLKKNPDVISFRISAFSDEDEVQKFQAIKVLIHPGYSPGKLYNDIAIIELNSDVKLSENIFPACIPSFEIEELGSVHRQTGLNVFPCNWFQEDDGCNPNVKVDSRNASVYVIMSNVSSPDECERRYSGSDLLNHKLNESMQFCSGTSVELVPETCQTDFGGSVGRQIFSFRRFFNFLFGVISEGVSCGAGQPSIVTRLSYYSDWLNQELFKQNTLTEEPAQDQCKIGLNAESIILTLSQANVTCKGAFLSNQKVLVMKSCGDQINLLTPVSLLSNDSTSIQEVVQEKHEDSGGTFMTLIFNETIAGLVIQPDACQLWHKKDTVPFKLSISGADVDLYALYPDTCKQLHDVSLGRNEFCAEPFNDHLDVNYVGTPVLESVMEVGHNYNYENGRLAGFITKILNRDNNWVAIISKIPSEVIN